jgi:hypothetical protein
VTWARTAATCPCPPIAPRSRSSSSESLSVIPRPSTWAAFVCPEVPHFCYGCDLRPSDVEDALPRLRRSSGLDLPTFNQVGACVV